MQINLVEIFIKSIFQGILLLFQNWKAILPFLILIIFVRKFNDLLKPQYGIKSTTNRGELVKSKGEKQIADLLNKYGIRYEYEKPLIVGWWIFKHKIANPDFYLLDYDVYIEYWGLVDADSDYKNTMKFKMKEYYDYGVKFISIYPNNMKNLDWILKKKFEEVTDQKFPTTKYFPKLDSTEL